MSLNLGIRPNFDRACVGLRSCKYASRDAFASRDDKKKLDTRTRTRDRDIKSQRGAPLWRAPQNKGEEQKRDHLGIC